MSRVPSHSGSGAGGFAELPDVRERALCRKRSTPFTEANPDCKLQATTFTSQDEAVSKLEGGFKAHVVYACLTDTQRLVSGSLVQPIDTSRLDAWKTLFPYFKDSAQIRVGDKVYMVPAFGGTTGLIYNPDEVPSGNHLVRRGCPGMPRLMEGVVSRGQPGVTGDSPWRRSPSDTRTRTT